MSTKERSPLLSEDVYRKDIEAWNGSIDDWERSIERKSYEIIVEYYEAARAKDAELIQQLVDQLQQIADEGHWTPDMSELINDAKAAGFTPTEE